jgi:hypothetical protein
MDCLLLKLAVFQISRACHERRINDSGIDEGEPTDSKKCRSEEARRRLVKTGQNQTRSQASQSRDIWDWIAKRGANGNTLKCFERLTEEQEIIGDEPGIIENAILVLRHRQASGSRYFCFDFRAKSPRILKARDGSGR